MFFFVTAPQIAHLTNADYQPETSDHNELQYRTEYLLSREKEISDACHKMEVIDELQKECFSKEGEMSKLHKHDGKLAQLEKVQIDQKV